MFLTPQQSFKCVIPAMKAKILQRNDRRSANHDTLEKQTFKANNLETDYKKILTCHVYITETKPIYPALAAPSRLKTEAYIIRALSAI